VSPRLHQQDARSIGDATPILTLLTREGITGKSAKEMRAERQAYFDAQPLTARCAFCAWEITLSAGEAIVMARSHRAVHHPDLAAPKKRDRTFIEQMEAAQQNRREKA